MACRTCKPVTTAVADDGTHCTMCDTKGTQKCGGCESMLYCSKKCQKLDWPVHKLVCKSLKDDDSARPSPNHHRAILFPQDEEKPRFVWVEFNKGSVTPDKSGPTEEELDTRDLVRHKWYSLPYNVILNRPIEGHAIKMMLPLCASQDPATYSPHEDYKGLPDDPNKSLMTIDAGMADWLRGPVLAWAELHPGLGGEGTLDLTAVDFRHTVDNKRTRYCRSDRNYDWHDHADCDCDCEKVPVVRMSSVGDKALCKGATYEMDEEWKHFVTGPSDILTPLADKIGIPLCVRKVAPQSEWGTLGKEYGKCKHAPWLNPPDQTVDTGTLLVSRRDGKMLLPDHLFAIVMYSGEALHNGPITEDSYVTAKTANIDRLEHVTKETFEKYYRTQWRKSPFSNKTCPSP